MEISFITAHTELKRAKNDRMAGFLKQYLPTSTTISWIEPLRKLRNHTAHGQVTDIVELRTPMPPNPKSIQLLGKSVDAKNDIELSVFIEQCFAGLETFLELLYENIAKQVEAEGSLPITGRSDHLI